jgi:hypothetical protein
MNTRRLICEGICVGDISVPAFHVSAGEYVGLADPSANSLQRYELMEVLGGLRPTTRVHLTCKSWVINAPGSGTWAQAGQQTITDYAVALGMSRGAAQEMITKLGLNPDLPWSHLQLTERLRLELRLAWINWAELVVLSTAGLDPAGIAAVAGDVSKMLAQCAAVHVISTALLAEYQSLNVYSRVIHCSLLNSV